MASSHLKSPVFLSLTFYGQNQVSATLSIVILQKKMCLFCACQIIVNTNGNGHLIDNALSLVCEALGPFRYDLSHHNYVHFPLFLNHWKITKQLSLGILNPSSLQYIVFQHYN